MNLETWLAQAGFEGDPMTGALVPPLHTATTFRRDDDYHLPADFVYARYGHPLAVQGEQLMMELEAGAATLLYSSGLAAMNGLLDAVPPGLVVAAPIVMYHGGRDVLQRGASKGRYEVRFFDALDPGSLRNVLADGRVDLVWVETLANPTWDVIDVARTADAAHQAGARLAVDGTATPPTTFQSLQAGADYAFHSGTKYLNGHSDVTAGVVTAAHEDARWDEMVRIRKQGGSILAPFETWLLLRGMRTLHLRWQRSTSNAQAVATFLEEHPAVDHVLYPGLVTHAGHELARRQFQQGVGGMLSALINGDADAAVRVATRLQVIKPATSLGGVESLVEHRATVEGPDSPVEPNLLRFSIGIENPADLVADIDQALT